MFAEFFYVLSIYLKFDNEIIQIKKWFLLNGNFLLATVITKNGS